MSLCPYPVSDIERAKTFYAETLGFHVDHDTDLSETVHFIQLTPPGSACSIVIGKGLGEMDKMQPGSVKGLLLVVKDIHEARELLVNKGIEAGDVIEYPRGIKFVHFNDPDGNMWMFQEIPPGI